MIKSVFIQNFRSIKELYVEPRSLCALIGPNSAGKTNVLKAIDLVLGEGWTTKAKIARELFLDESKPVIVEIRFSEPVPFRTPYDGLVPIDRVTLRLEFSPEFKAETRLHSDASPKLFYLNDEFKKSCHFIYIPAQRDLTDQMRVSGWTLLGKLMRVVYENYVRQFASEEQLRNTFKDVMQAPKEFLELDFDPNEVTFKKFVDSFKKYCLDNSSGFASSLEPQLNIYNLNWFYKTLQISVKENHSDKDFDCEEVGAGMQNLILISIFQTYAELMGGKVIFGIEEPEIYLYPQAQRCLYHSFQELAEKTQILYTTHNPNFIDAQRAYEIELLQKSKEVGTYICKKLPFINELEAQRQRFKIFAHFNTERNEIFFARKVLLVEGPSDKILFTVLLQDKWGVNINNDGISIIECGGKGGVLYFSGLCMAMGMNNYFAVWDEDDKEINDPKNFFDKLLAEHRGLQISPNLEVSLGLNPNSKDKIKQAYEWASEVSNDNIPDFLLCVKEFCNAEHKIAV